MKILVVSDTHGRHGNLEAAIETEKPFDMLLHLGDVEDGEDYIRAIAECDVKMVSGNNDYYSDLPSELEFVIGGLKVYMTHGHRQYVSLGTSKIAQEAKERNADIVMFGHVHYPVLEEVGGVTVLCPGSIAFPRQPGRKPSYATIELTKEFKPNYSIHYQ